MPKLHTQLNNKTGGRPIHDVCRPHQSFRHSLSCGELWKIMVKFGCPLRFIAKVQQLHDGMQARVQDDGEFSELGDK